MHSIVLVKQVPDVANIPEDAWDREKGTLRRGVLDSVLNPLDLHALTFALDLRQAEPASGSRVLCLTMGPPQARAVLLDGLARGADNAVLLTDRAFGGADTWATAYTLARAIRKIAGDIFSGEPYAIVAGMQSVDGDTAQVPAQVAEDLDIEHIAYAQSLDLTDGMVITRIGPTGMETVRPLARPFLVTVTACTQPRYRSFHRARASQRQAIQEWNAAAIGAEPQRIGLPGSRTQVFRIYSPSEERHKTCQYFTDAAALVAAVRERYVQGPAPEAVAQGASYRLDGKPPSYHGDVWVYVEQADGQIRSVSLELLSEARKLATCLEVQVGAVLLGHGVEALAAALIAQGADTVYLADDPHLRHFRPIPYKKAVGELVIRYRPQIMLFGATPLGRELAPRVAYGSDAGLTADCTSLAIDDVARGGVTLTAILKQTRPALGGNIMATIMTKGSLTQMATVRPGVFKADAADPARTGAIVRHTPALTEADIRTEILSIAPLPPRSGVAEADIVVSGGRGLGAKARYEQHLRALAAAIAGALPGRVELGASRMAVEDGFIGHDHQVGQTGQTVQPRLYLAIGISGAVQHVSGMQNAGLVVAINKDPHARIFNVADFGMIADLEIALPALTAAFAAGRTT